MAIQVKSSQWKWPTDTPDKQISSVGEYPAELPKLDPAFAVRMPALAEWLKQMAEWWFNVRTVLLRLQSAVTNRNLPAGATIGSKAICRIFTATFTGRLYNSRGYADVPHDLASQDVMIQVYRTRDATGMADVDYPAISTNPPHGDAKRLTAETVRIELETTPNDNEEFKVLIAG